MNQIDTENLIHYWVEASEDDLKSASEIIANTKSYIQGLFFLHLSLEKLLKAYFVKSHKEFAPLSHNLLYLSKRCFITFDNPSYEVTLSEINQFNLEMRYPEDLKKLKQKVNLEYANQKLREGEKVYQWILQKLN